MTINITLFIQAFNFVCAYFLLKWLFFKPSLSVVFQENDIYNSLLENREATRITLQEKQQYAYNRRQYYRNELAQIIPEKKILERKIEIEALKEPKKREVSSNLINKLILMVVEKVNG